MKFNLTHFHGIRTVGRIFSDTNEPLAQLQFLIWKVFELMAPAAA